MRFLIKNRLWNLSRRRLVRVGAFFIDRMKRLRLRMESVLCGKIKTASYKKRFNANLTQNSPFGVYVMLFFMTIFAGSSNVCFS